MGESSQWLEGVCAVHRRSGRLAVIDASGPVSGHDLLGKAVAAAGFLSSLNTDAGQPVPALLTTNAEALALLLGGASANRPVAPIGARLTVAELTAVVRGTGSRVVLTEAGFTATARQVAEAVDARMVVVPALPVSAETLPTRCGPAAFYLHTLWHDRSTQSGPGQRRGTRRANRGVQRPDRARA